MANSPRIERFEYPAPYGRLGRVNDKGEVELDHSIEDYEHILAIAWDLQHRALARLFLEIARLRQSAQ